MVVEFKSPLINQSKQEFASLCYNHPFPNILGLVDGTHVGILAPPRDEDRYINRKNYHSINCQVVTNAKCLFLDVCAKWPGSSHDSLIWRESSVKRRLRNGEIGSGWFLGNLLLSLIYCYYWLQARSCHAKQSYHLLASDSGYPAEPWLMTPFREPITAGQQSYNISHKTTRSSVERTIGVWKSRFRSMHK